LTGILFWNIGSPLLTSEPFIGGNASLQEYNLATRAILGFNLLREAEEYSMISGYKIVSMNLTESSRTLPFPAAIITKICHFGQTIMQKSESLVSNRFQRSKICLWNQLDITQMIKD
jgi:hypothetical protein